MTSVLNPFTTIYDCALESKGLKSAIARLVVIIGSVLSLKVLVYDLPLKPVLFGNNKTIKTNKNSSNTSKTLKRGLITHSTVSVQTSTVVKNTTTK